MIIYFEYPERRGGVFELNVPNGHLFSPDTDIVQLNDSAGTKVSLTMTNETHVSSVTKIVNEGFTFPGRIWKATLVFREKDAVQQYDQYDRNWSVLIPKINAAAAVNTLFVVLLPETEYQRLLAGGLDDLKDKLSPRAASLVTLNDRSSIDWSTTKPALDLYRTGRCR